MDLLQGVNLVSPKRQRTYVPWLCMMSGKYPQTLSAFFLCKNTIFLLKTCENIHSFFEKKKKIFTQLEILYNSYDYQHENKIKLNIYSMKK